MPDQTLNMFIVDGESKLELESELFGQGRYGYHREIALGPMDHFWYFLQSDRRDRPPVITGRLTFREWLDRLGRSGYRRIFYVHELGDVPSFHRCLSVHALAKPGGDPCALQFDFDRGSLTISEGDVDVAVLVDSVLWFSGDADASVGERSS